MALDRYIITHADNTPQGGTGRINYYVADTYAGRPVTGLNVGDLMWAKDVGEFYIADSATTWAGNINVEQISLLSLILTASAGNYHLLYSTATVPRILGFPDTGGTLVELDFAQLMSNKSLDATCILIADTSSSGVSFADATTATKRLRLVLSGAVGNNSLVIASTAARAWTLPDVTGTADITIFTQTATGTVGNTATETDLVSTGVGSIILPANALIAGRTVVLDGWGYYSADTADYTLSIRTKLTDSTPTTVTLATATGSIAVVATNNEFRVRTVFTCRTTGSTGTVFAQMYVFFENSQAFLQGTNTAVATIDTTKTQAISITADWTAAQAGNTISLSNLTAKVMN